MGRGGSQQGTACPTLLHLLEDGGRDSCLRVLPKKGPWPPGRGSRLLICPVGSRNCLGFELLGNDGRDWS